MKLSKESAKSLLKVLRTAIAASENKSKDDTIAQFISNIFNNDLATEDKETIDVMSIAASVNGDPVSNFEFGEDIDILQLNIYVDGRLIQNKPKIKIYNTAGGQTSGDNLPTSNHYTSRSLYYDSVKNRLMVGSNIAPSCWILDLNDDSARLLNNTSTDTGGAYVVTGDPIPAAGVKGDSTFPWYDSERDELILVGGFGVWVLNEGTNIAVLYDENHISASGDNLSEFFNNLGSTTGGVYLGKGICALSAISSNDGFIFNFIENSGKYLTDTTTKLGGKNAVKGDPWPWPFLGGGFTQQCWVVDENNILFGHQDISGVTGVWLYDLKNNIGREIRGNNYGINSEYRIEIKGDPIPSAELNHPMIAGGYFSCGSFSNGVYILDLETMEGRHITIVSGSPGGAREVKGQIFDNNNQLGNQYSDGKFYYKSRSGGAIWVYEPGKNFSKNKGTLISHGETFNDTTITTLTASNAGVIGNNKSGRIFGIINGPTLWQIELKPEIYIGGDMHNWREDGKIKKGDKLFLANYGPTTNAVIANKNIRLEFIRKSNK